MKSLGYPCTDSDAFLELELRLHRALERFEYVLTESIDEMASLADVDFDVMLFALDRDKYRQSLPPS